MQKITAEEIANLERAAAAAREEKRRMAEHLAQMKAM
jgi:hypothetical protein